MRIVTSANTKSASVSFRVANTTSLAHNNRENTHGNPDIDPSRIKDNVTYVRENIEDVYQREFTEAVAEYNSKQKRSDRKIDDYLKKILNDSKTHHQREIVVAIGKKDDGIDWEYKKDILEEYAKDFQKGNPNLKVYNSVLHMDEANPHLHINYVPVYENNKGLKKRVGHDKAIQQQGYEDFTEWQAEQRETLENLMRGYDLRREHVGSHEYRPVAEYKAIKDEIKELENTRNTLGSEIKERTERLNTLQKLPKLKAVNVEVETRPNRLNQNEVIVEKKDFERLQKLARSAKAHSIKMEYYEKYATKASDSITTLRTQNDKILNQNVELLKRVDVAEKKANKWEKKFKELSASVKEFVQDIFSFLPDFIEEGLHYFIKSFEDKIREIEQTEQRVVNKNRSRSNELEL